MDNIILYHYYSAKSMNISSFVLFYYLLNPAAYEGIKAPHKGSAFPAT